MIFLSAALKSISGILSSYKEYSIWCRINNTTSFNYDVFLSNGNDPRRYNQKGDMKHALAHADYGICGDVAYIAIL